MTKKALNLGQYFKPKAADDPLDFLIGGMPEETAHRAEERGLPLLHLPTHAIAPDPAQLRHLPPPHELTRMAQAGDQAAATLVASLRELGQSLHDNGQIQPVIVYRDEDPQHAMVTHRLLNGQRRWSAAVLTNLPTVWAVEVERPTDVRRLVQQFEENERREGFSDMERAWSLIALKEALQQEAAGEVPWGVIEDQVQISPQRRQDLLRLLRFSAEAQALIMRYGWSEWTLRPLHMAVSANQLSQQDAADILQVLSEGPDVNATIVKHLVAEYIRQLNIAVPALSEQKNSTTKFTQHNDKDIIRRITRLSHTIEQLRAGLGPSVDPRDRQSLRDALHELQRNLTTLLLELENV
ncbi:MAG: hypothetical protein NVS2B7_13150 [Herpetosiphon sp.]